MGAAKAVKHPCLCQLRMLSSLTPLFAAKLLSLKRYWAATSDLSCLIARYRLGNQHSKDVSRGNHRSNTYFRKSRKVLYTLQFSAVLRVDVEWKHLEKEISSKRMKFNLFNCKAFRKKKHVAQGGAILDQVISESCSPNNKVLLYKLANYKLGTYSITQFTWECVWRNEECRNAESGV